MTDQVAVEKKGPVTIVTINRPEVRNAVDRDTAHALAQAFLAFEQDDEAKVGVFAGAHGSFCAGADLKALSQDGVGAQGVVGAGSAPSAGARLSAPKIGFDFDRLDTGGPMGPSRMVLSKPVIGAISGHAVAGGMELALWCDLRVMEEDAIMGIFCRRWGVPLIDGGTVRLPRLIGQARALDLILTGRPVGAEEALQMGLANRVVAKGRALAAAEELALSLAAFPQACLYHDRMSVYEQGDMGFGAAMANEFAHGRQVIGSGETLAGAARFASGKGRGGRFDDI